MPELTPAKLRVLTGPHALTERAVPPTGLSLGRQKAPSEPGHLPVASPSQVSVSRDHATIRHDKARDEWWLELRSRHNPMWVNEDELNPHGSQKRVTLRDGAVLRFPAKPEEVVAIFTVERAQSSGPPERSGLPQRSSGIQLGAELLEDIEDAVRFGQRRRAGLAETVTQLNEAYDRIEGTLRRADPAALRAEVEDQLAHKEGSLRDATARLSDVGVALDDALELLERVKRGAQP